MDRVTITPDTDVTSLMGKWDAGEWGRIEIVTEGDHFDIPGYGRGIMVGGYGDIDARPPFVSYPFVGALQYGDTLRRI